MYLVLCFELSGMLDGQIMKAVTLQAKVSLVLAVSLTSSCVGPNTSAVATFPVSSMFGMSSGCMAVDNMYWLVISNNFSVCCYFRKGISTLWYRKA